MKREKVLHALSCVAFFTINICKSLFYSPQEPSHKTLINNQVCCEALPLLLMDRFIDIYCSVL